MAEANLTSSDCVSIEAIRARFRPERITTLFVGESPPVSGAFFYCGNNAMLNHMQQAVEAVTGKSSNFLDSFKAYGWFLDDLVRTTIDTLHLTRLQREAEWRAAQASLVDRIAEYQPRFIVSMLLSIKNVVEEAALAAHSDAERFAVPFSGYGHVAQFRKEMARILPVLLKNVPSAKAAPDVASDVWT